MVIAFEAQRCRSNSVRAAHHDTRLDDALSRVPNFHVGEGEVVSDAVPNSRWHHAELPGSRINSRLHRLVDVIGDPPGNLGALRVARNDNPPWESVLSCAEPVANSSSLHVLSGIRPGGLGRLETAAMEALVETILANGVAVVADVRCSLGALDQTPEKTAVDAILGQARRVFWVSRATNLGVLRLVRDWNLLSELTDDAENSILLRVSERSDGVGLREAAEALWGFTGCSDIRSLSDSRSPVYGTWLTELLHGFLGTGQSPLSPPRAQGVRWGQSLRALLTKGRSEPLP